MKKITEAIVAILIGIAMQGCEVSTHVKIMGQTFKYESFADSTKNGVAPDTYVPPSKGVDPDTYTGYVDPDTDLPTTTSTQPQLTQEEHDLFEPQPQSTSDALMQFLQFPATSIGKYVDPFADPVANH